MKRLSLLVLSILMLTLLSMPASAGNQKVTLITDDPPKIPVELTVDTSKMVNVTIEWDALTYTYDGKTFSSGTDGMPKITVTNNDSSTPVKVLPTFVPDENLGFEDNDFDLYLFGSASDTPKNNPGITEAVSVECETSVVFYAVPSGTPTNSSVLAGAAKPLEVGNVRITIEKP